MYLENFIQKEIIIINLYKPLIINKTSKTKIGKQKLEIAIVSSKMLTNLKSAKADFGKN